jgi:hypothetical protein
MLIHYAVLILGREGFCVTSWLSEKNIVRSEESQVFHQAAVPQL